MKKIFIVGLFLISCAAFAFQQTAIKHKVQEGETVENIAKKYRVTPYDIIRLNPDVRNGLEVGTVLIIGSASPEKDKDTTVEPSVNKQTRQPYGFIRHKVKRKETLFSLSRKYRVTQDEIKRYNRELYSRNLKKGMRLQIPKFRNPLPPKNDMALRKDSLEIYIVQPKETRWSIAHKYGISVDSLHRLNPEMKEIIEVGEQLKLPKMVSSDSLSSKAFKEYIVPPKQTMYSLTRELELTQHELEALNPALKDVGLQSGMVLKIPNREVREKLVNADNYVFYEVKPKEGFYRLKIKLGASRDELETWNPSLKEKGLIAGMILKMPKDRGAGFDIRNSVIIEKFDLRDSIKMGARAHISFVLPFRLKNIDFDSLASTKKRIQKDNATMYAVDFYSGALMALDSIKKLGISVNVTTFDSEASKNKVRKIAEEYNFSNTQAVIGPIYPDAFNELAKSLKDLRIPIFSPLTNSKINVEENVFLTVPTSESLRDLMIHYIKQNIGEGKLFIIADEVNMATREKLLQYFPEAEVIEPASNLFIKMEDIEPLLSDEQENWFVVEAGSEALLANVTSVLNSVNSGKRRIKMFTTYRSKIYDSENISNIYLSRLNFHYPQTDGIASDNDTFVKNYRSKYGFVPNRYATRGFDITFDVLLKLAYDPDFYTVSRKVGETAYVENKFSYNKKFFSGYYNTSGHIMMYENMEIKEAPNAK